jgi:hypothetical protein
VRFRNVSGTPQDLPTLDLRVDAGEEFDATGDDAKSLSANPAFERTDKPSKTGTDTEEK